MLTFQRVDPDCETEIDALLRWENDPVLSETLRPNFDGVPLIPITRDEVIKAYRQPDRICFLFREQQDEKWLGYVQVQLSHPVMMGEREHGGWLAICVGEHSARGKGYGKKAMQYIEDYAKSIGLTRLELGVFDFNTAARALYKSCGYREFAVEPDFAWHNGIKFSDIRMEKQI